MTPRELITQWREEARVFETYGDALHARACALHAQQLEEALRAEGDEELTLTQAADASGYSERRLRELITDGTIANRGRKGAPRIRRADLPRRARRDSGAAVDDVTSDARRLVGRIG